MPLAADGIPIEAAAPPDGREVELLGRAAGRFHEKLVATLPAVQELAGHDLQLWAVARSLTAAMVTIELAIAVLGAAESVAIARFDGPISEPQSGDAGSATGSRNDRASWEQVWSLRRSAISFCGRLNRCHFFAVPFGLTAAQRRVVTTALLAVGHTIETIGGLRIPDQFYELVR